eukprot:COSAG02_NODE_3235_length_7127_cov_4.823847_10_plen_190_part_00
MIERVHLTRVDYRVRQAFEHMDRSPNAAPRSHLSQRLGRLYRSLLRRTALRSPTLSLRVAGSIRKARSLGQLSTCLRQRQESAAEVESRESGGSLAVKPYAYERGGAERGRQVAASLGAGWLSPDPWRDPQQESRPTGRPTKLATFGQLVDATWMESAPVGNGGPVGSSRLYEFDQHCLYCSVLPALPP